jgi:ABC-2 type transport system permease protein
MGLYIEIFRYRFSRFLTYPLELLAFALKRVVEIIFLLVLWNLISQSSHSTINIREIASYFLVALGISDIVMSKWGALGTFLAKLIKSGELSNYMVKPVHLIMQSYANAMGNSGLRIIFALINVILGIAINPPQSLIAVGLFIVLLVAAFLTSFSFNILIASLYFHFTEASGIKNAIEHLARICSGTIVPLYLFPENIKQIVELTPFPVMLYGPAHALRENVLTQEVIVQVLISYMWVFLMGIVASVIWTKSIKAYESTGI